MQGFPKLFAYSVIVFTQTLLHVKDTTKDKFFLEK